MNRYKRSLISKTLIFTLLVMFLFTLIGCNTEKEAEKITLKLYFLQKQNGKLVPEERQVEVPKEKDKNIALAEIAIKELLKGPENKNLKRILPENTKLLDIEIEDNLVKANFSRHINDLSDIEIKKLAVMSIVETLTQLPGIEEVNIMSEGRDLLSADDQPYGPLARNDLDKIQEEPKSKPKTLDVTVYFSDDEAMYLVPEIRKVKLESKSIEEAVIQELINGPEKKEHFKTIPEGTKLLSIKTEDKTAYVDFSKEFKENHPGGSTGEIMTIYSIVNSLTELDNIEKVIFLVEGQKEKTLAGHLIFDEPFYRDESLIKK